MCPFIMYFIIFMKEEPEVIRQIRLLTDKTIQNFKIQATDECSAGGKSCSVQFLKKIQIIQAFVHGIISEVGNEYLKTIKNWTAECSSTLAMRTENRDLQSKLDHAYQLIQEKSVRIEDLQSKNYLLSQTVVALQERLVLQASVINSDDILSQDSLEEVQIEQLEEYISENESEEEEAFFGYESGPGL